MKKHTVTINVANANGDKERVLTRTRLTLPKRLLRFLFGEFCQVLVLNPGDTVSNIEIHERGDSIGEIPC